MARGAGQGSVGPQGLWGKRGARELERASSQSHSARNCDIHPVPCRYPVDRQPHSHRFCASTGDRKSSHQAAPIVCSQFALLSPDSATSQQYIATYLRQQCLHVEKDVVSTEAEAMPAAISAAVDAAAMVEATATLGITTPHMPPTSRSRSPQRRCRSTPWLPRVFTVTLASLLCQCITSVCSRLNRSSRFSTQELLPPSSGSTRTALTAITDFNTRFGR